MDWREMKAGAIRGTRWFRGVISRSYPVLGVAAIRNSKRCALGARIREMMAIAQSERGLSRPRRATDWRRTRANPSLLVCENYLRLAALMDSNSSHRWNSRASCSLAAASSAVSWLVCVACVR